MAALPTAAGARTECSGRGAGRGRRPLLPRRRSLLPASQPRAADTSVVRDATDNRHHLRRTQVCTARDSCRISLLRRWRTPPCASPQSALLIIPSLLGWWFFVYTVVGAMTRRMFAKRESLNTCRSSLLRLYQCYIFIICRRCGEVSGRARRFASYFVGRRVAGAAPDDGDAGASDLGLCSLSLLCSCVVLISSGIVYTLCLRIPNYLF